MIQTKLALKLFVLPADMANFDNFIILSYNRVYTKIHRVCTIVLRVYTKIRIKFYALKPCSDERVTVFARQHTVSTHQFSRVSTKVNRDYTLKTPWEHENETPIISSYYPNSPKFLQRMYVSILLNYKSLLTTTYEVAQNLINRVSTKAYEGRSYVI